MNVFLTLAIILFGYMTFWFLISLLIKRNDIADIAWGIGFIVMAWSSYYLFRNFTASALIVSLLVTLWGTRLALHILKRFRTRGEDSRYLNWREKWGEFFYIRSYLQIYILQGFLLFVISTPVFFINGKATTSLDLLTLIGTAVWLLGFFFEAIADFQLAQFVSKAENKGRIMQSGLWKFSRHPNYFGEVVLWWGIFIMALSIEKGVYTIIGPLTITGLILFVSGIPLLEKKYHNNPNYKEYKSRTSAFFPLPPKINR